MRVEPGTTWLQVSAGSGHTCGIKTDGTAWCWGEGGNGQLGNGSNSESPVPVLVSGGGTWKSISAGQWYSCGIRSDDTARCWGAGWTGALGTGAGGDVNVPTVLSGGGTWKSIDAGLGHTCGIRSDDTGRCWGANFYGEVGDNSLTTRYAPVALSGGGTWKSISTGNGHVGTLNNMDPMTDWVAGKVGNALDFDGSNDYVSFINDIPFAYGYFSIAGWFYVRGTGGVDDEFPVFMQRDFDTGNGQSTVGIVVRNSNKKVHAQIRDDVDTLIQCIGSTTITWNNWYHFAVVRTSDNIKLYINGVQDCSTNFSRWGSFSANIAVREIGRHTNSSGTGGIANGRIDELRVYNRVLSLSEIQALAAQ